MIQTHTMLFWSYPIPEEFETSVQKGYDILTVLKKYGDDLSPNYLPGYRKKDAKRYTLEYDSFKEILKKGVSTEGNLTFPDFGFRAGFFSSLDDEQASGVSFTLGTTNKKFINVVTIELADNYDLKIMSEKSEQIIALFKKIVKIFNPFWAGIINGKNRRLYDGFWNEKKSIPTTIHWINYWNNDVVKRVKEKRIIKTDLFQKEKLENGYFLQLKETPIDDDSEKDIKLQQDTNKSLGLTKTFSLF